MCPHTICVLILYVSSYYICILPPYARLLHPCSRSRKKKNLLLLKQLYMCPHTHLTVRMLLYVSAYYEYTCPPDMRFFLKKKSSKNTRKKNIYIFFSLEKDFCIAVHLDNGDTPGDVGHGEKHFFFRHFCSIVGSYKV